MILLVAFHEHNVQPFNTSFVELVKVERQTEDFLGLINITETAGYKFEFSKPALFIDDLDCLPIVLVTNYFALGSRVHFILTLALAIAF